MSKQKNNVNDLLAAIKRQPTAATPERVEPEISTAKHVEKEPDARPRTSGKTPAKETAPKSRMGKPVQFWMHDADRKLVRELAAWLAGQGLRTTDSLVIRAALRMAKTGSGLLGAYEEAAKFDGRLKRD